MKVISSFLGILYKDEWTEDLPVEITVRDCILSHRSVEILKGFVEVLKYKDISLVSSGSVDICGSWQPYMCSKNGAITVPITYIRPSTYMVETFSYPATPESQ